MNALTLIQATVEPGSRAAFRYPAVYKALTQCFGAPVSKDNSDGLEMQYVFRGIPSKPGGLLASCYVYQGDVSLHADFYLLGGLIYAGVEPHRSSRTEADVVREIHRVTGLAGSREFKELVSGQDDVKIAGYLRSHGFQYNNADILGALRELNNTPAMLAWARG